MASKITLILAVILVALGCTACNTMEGIGEDVGAAGEGLERSAEKSKNY